MTDTLEFAVLLGLSRGHAAKLLRCETGHDRHLSEDAPFHGRAVGVSRAYAHG
jgi:hypothetical protein